MEKLNFKFNSNAIKNANFGLTSGVVNSGNLEIMAIANNDVATVSFDITTTVPGFSKTWESVLGDFASNYNLGGSHLLLNDCGATPAVVALRLRQLYEGLTNSHHKDFTNSHYIELNARDRISAVLDKNSFNEFLKPIEMLTSPHLVQLDLPAEFDDGVIIGSGKFEGQDVYIASQNFAFMGGAVGEINGAKLAGLCQKALKNKISAVILLIDSGGVRLHEANAGEIAISELIASVMQLRLAGIPILGVVAGKNGAFGGVGILSQCLDTIFVTENARTGVSGPEVIETVMGVAEYDSTDRALVWRTCGGRHRSIIGDGKYIKKDVSSIKTAIQDFLGSYTKMSINTLLEENQFLQKRIDDNATCIDGTDIWSKYGYADSNNIPNLSDDAFLEILK